jgi:hypothetical protein
VLNEQRAWRTVNWFGGEPNTSQPPHIGRHVRHALVDVGAIRDGVVTADVGLHDAAFLRAEVHHAVQRREHSASHPVMRHHAPVWVFDHHAAIITRQAAWQGDEHGAKPAELVPFAHRPGQVPARQELAHPHRCERSS